MTGGDGDTAGVLTLSLISHTNVGKTTLARTLLRRDVGEAFDQPHVTDENTRYTLVRSSAGDELCLWDTPGFGDSARLLKRLKQSERPFGWVLTQVWDRVADRAMWCSQQAIRNVREEADVVLYLVNAAEDPALAGYVAPEMEILAWAGCPVVVLLNQTGGGLGGGREEEDERRWAAAFEGQDVVRGVIGLDAFARCWVQEGALLRHLEGVFEGEKRARMERLRGAWEEANLEVFRQSMGVLEEALEASLDDRVEVSKETLAQKVGVGRGVRNRELAAVRDGMVRRFAERVRGGLDRLIETHGLQGKSAREMKRVASDFFDEPREINESIWTAVGGVTSGALAGLVVDLKAGGLSFGGGALLGSVVGGAGAYGLARGYNLVRSSDRRVRWSEAHFRSQVELWLLLYLAVAHHGRGRGDWVDGEFPEAWGRVVGDEVGREAEALKRWWERRGGGGADVLGRIARRVLARLYPECAGW